MTLTPKPTKFKEQVGVPYMMVTQADYDRIDDMLDEAREMVTNIHRGIN